MGMRAQAFSLTLRKTIGTLKIFRPDRHAAIRRKADRFHFCKSGCLAPRLRPLSPKRTAARAPNRPPAGGLATRPGGALARRPLDPRGPCRLRLALALHDLRHVLFSLCLT